MFVDAAQASNLVTMICPNLKCRKVLQVPAKYRGQNVKCQYCGIVFGVPLPKATTGPGNAGAGQGDAGNEEEKKKGKGKEKA
jgi:hypothetical protein